MSTEPRGPNRDPTFERWWESDGRHLCARVTDTPFSNPTAMEKKIMRFGFIWGWNKRAERDAKARRKRK